MRYILLSLLLSLTFTACNSSSTPAEVSEEFLSSLAEGDSKSARKLSTLDTVKLLDIAATFGSIPRNPDFAFTLVKEEINATSAIVTYQDGNKTAQTLHLIQQDGSWKVNETKK